MKTKEFGKTKLITYYGGMLWSGKVVVDGGVWWMRLGLDNWCFLFYLFHFFVFWVFVFLLCDVKVLIRNGNENWETMKIGWIEFLAPTSGEVARRWRGYHVSIQLLQSWYILYLGGIFVTSFLDSISFFRFIHLLILNYLRVWIKAYWI